MKHTIITVAIAVVTGVSGYLLVANESKLEGMFESFKQEKFSSETVFQINYLGSRNGCYTSFSKAERQFRSVQFLETQFEMLKSEETLKKAIKDYKLDELLSEDEEGLLKELSECVEVEQIRGTDLIRLTAAADSDLEAQQITYAVIKSYVKRRAEALDRRRKESKDEYSAKREIQEDKLEDIRTVLYGLSKRLNIPYRPKGGSSIKNKEANAKIDYSEAKHSTDQLESFVNSLAGLSDEDLMVTLIASGRPESVVLKDDYEKLSNLKQRKNVALATGIGKEHRTIKSLDSSIAETQKRLDASIARVRKKLKMDLAVFDSNAEKLRLGANKEREGLIITAEEKMKFGKAREDYERELSILDAIKQAEFSETLGAGLERDPIILHETDWSDEALKSMKEPE